MNADEMDAGGAAARLQARALLVSQPWQVATMGCQTQNQTPMPFAALGNATESLLCLSFLTCKPGRKVYLAQRGCEGALLRNREQQSSATPSTMLSTTTARGNNYTHNVRISKKSNGEGFDSTTQIPGKSRTKLSLSQAPTLAELTAGLPRAICIPVKLLRFVLNGDIKRVANVRIVQIAH